MAQGDERQRKGQPVNHESAELEVVFRIVHVALDEGSPPADGLPPSYREQTVEVTLGPNPTFRSGDVGTLTCRVPAGQVVNAVPLSRRQRASRPRQPKPVGPPRIVETLRRAIEWRRQLDTGEVRNQAAIARREGITRARVTQVLALLRLPTEIRHDIMAAQDDSQCRCLSEHALRRIASVRNRKEQVALLKVFVCSRQDVAPAQ